MGAGAGAAFVGKMSKDIEAAAAICAVPQARPLPCGGYLATDGAEPSRIFKSLSVKATPRP